MSYVLDVIERYSEFGRPSSSAVTHDGPNIRWSEHFILHHESLQAVFPSRVLSRHVIAKEGAVGFHSFPNGG